jgi:hypothetical protein
MHHEASQRDPLAAFFATPRVVDLSFPEISSYPTVYVWCVLDLWEVLYRTLLGSRFEMRLPHRILQRERTTRLEGLE